MKEGEHDIKARFIELLGSLAADILGPKELAVLVPEIKVRTGLSRFWKGAVHSTLDTDDRIGLEKRVQLIISHLEEAFGLEVTEEWLEDVYTKLERDFTPAIANGEILPLISEKYLEQYRLRLLSRDDLASMLEHERKRDRELAQANAELREIDRRKSEFISVVAHQLRTPLGGFKWALDLLIKEESGPLTEDQKDILTKSYAENERMIGLVEEMLHADRIEGGQFSLSPNPTDLVQVVKEVIKNLTPMAEKKNIRITLPHPDALPTLMIDGAKVHDVFQNIIENAIRYSVENEVIEILIRKTDREVTVSITDHGIGIPKAAGSEIFSRFYRADNARRFQPDGNGLGLYIAKNIVLLHGGSIRFESEEYKGTTFIVSFPL